MKAIGLGILLFLGFIAILYLFQRHFIYLPDKTMPNRSDFNAGDMEEVRLSTSDNLSLLAWYKPAKKGLPTIVYFHGNAGHIGYRMPLARQLLNAGFGLVLVEYRGYGGNDGKPAEMGLYKDAEAAMHFLQHRSITSKRVVLFGESLGSGVAIYIAAKERVCAVILQSPYTSMTDMVKYHYPWLFLIKPWDRYDSLKRITHIRTPLLIMHGQQDNIVPFSQGEQLFQQAPEPKQIIAFTDRGHNDLWDESYYQSMIDFINAYCPYDDTP